MLYYIKILVVTYDLSCVGRIAFELCGKNCEEDDSLCSASVFWFYNHKDPLGFKHMSSVSKILKSIVDMCNFENT